MALPEWQSLDLTEDPDEARFDGDPAELVDALAELLELIRRPPWVEHAACRGRGTAEWFPNRGESIAPAAAICAGCPVQTECLRAGQGEHHGIWGGLSERGRRRLRRTSTDVDTAA